MKNFHLTHLKEFSISIFLVFICFLLLYPFTNTRSILLQGDEEMHIATVRESIKTHQYLFPVLENYMNLYKPPLLFWLGMGIDNFFNEMIYPERLISIFIYSLNILIFYISLRLSKLDIQSSLGFSILLLSTLAVFKFSRLFMIESLMSLGTFSITILLLIYNLKKSRIALFIAGLLTGLFVLAKGPIFIVYLGILSLSFSFVKIFTLNANSIWIGKKRLRSEFKSNFLLLCISILVPFVWIFILYFYTNSGKNFLYFFIMNENLGKFSSSSTNQSWWILIYGLIIYSYPSTFFVLDTLSSLRKKKSNRLILIYSKALILSSLVIILIHFLPNRKDAYYVIPIIPTLFFSSGVVFYHLGNKDQISLLKRGIYSIFFFLLLQILSLFIFHFYFNKNFYFEIISLLILFTLILIYKFKIKSKSEYFTLYVIISILTISHLQFRILPSISLEDLPKTSSLYDEKKICIISENPWDGLIYKNLIQNADVIHTLPNRERGMHK
jgi:4-amino-4-deoxy-L-arabinose transferase-like glycosyltransferase